MLRGFLVLGPDSGCDVARFLPLLDFEGGGDWARLGPGRVERSAERVVGMVMGSDGGGKGVVER